MNISSENFGKYRVTRHQNDAVTVLNTIDGSACNYPGGLQAFAKMKDDMHAHSKSRDHFIASVVLGIHTATTFN